VVAVTIVAVAVIVVEVVLIVAVVLVVIVVAVVVLVAVLLIKGVVELAVVVGAATAPVVVVVVVVEEEEEGIYIHETTRRFLGTHSYLFLGPATLTQWYDDCFQFVLAEAGELIETMRESEMRCFPMGPFIELL
jgi:hypothetical protein